MLTRRALLAALAATLTPRLVHAQSAPPRVGWLSAASEPDPFLEAFREGLRKLGYVEGRNVTLITRHAKGNLDALLAGAVELVQSPVAVIVASMTAVRAARTIKDIPIVFTISGDPIEARLAQTISRPGGNLTGATFLSLEVAGKRVELLKQAVPRLRTLAVLSNTIIPARNRSCGRRTASPTRSASRSSTWRSLSPRSAPVRSSTRPSRRSAVRSPTQ